MNQANVAVENPWSRLPGSAPFVLAEDRALIEAFNVRARGEHRIDLTSLPEPFLGRHDAPVVVLGLNPGWSSEDTGWHVDPEFIWRSRANLEQSALSHPFFLLDPALDAPGSRWWRRVLRRPIEDAGSAAVAHRLLCIEYFPYHSQRYGARVPRLPSQEFGFELVRAAIEREAVIVVMRSARLWEAAVPELVNYGRRFKLVNVQNVALSPGNCPAGYGEIVAALRTDR